jgi:acetaldehyde dehydrogenase/alcohol dehydrogenase
LGGQTPDEKVEKLIEAVDGLKRELNVPGSIEEAGVTETEFLAKVDELAELAFDDQCTGANPRYPLMAEIRELYLKAFRSKVNTVV